MPAKTARCPLCNQPMRADASMASRAAAGGLAVLEKYGPEHFKALRAKGGRKPRTRHSKGEGRQAAGGVVGKDSPGGDAMTPTAGTRPPATQKAPVAPGANSTKSLED